MKDLYNPKEIAQILQVHEKTVRRYLRDGVIRGQKIGGSWKISKEVLMKYLDKQPKEDMTAVYDRLVGSKKSSICLTIKVQVKDAKEGHQYAKLFMTLISKYDTCNFNYQMEEETANYLLCGQLDFIREAIDLIEEAGVIYESH